MVARPRPEGVHLIIVRVEIDDSTFQDRRTALSIGFHDSRPLLRSEVTMRKRDSPGRYPMETRQPASEGPHRLQRKPFLQSPPESGTSASSTSNCHSDSRLRREWPGYRLRPGPRTSPHQTRRGADSLSTCQSANSIGGCRYWRRRSQSIHWGNRRTTPHPPLPEC